MKSIIGAGLALVFATSALAQPTAEQLETAAQLRDQALESELAWDIVESLTTEIGPRLGGSEAEARAANGGVNWVRSSGSTVWSSKSIPCRIGTAVRHRSL